MVRQITQFDTADDFVIYPESDGKPMADNTIQFRWIVYIKENLEIMFAANPDVFIAGDLLWYPIKGKLKNCAPDAMVVFGRPKGDRSSYLQWDEGNIPPQVVFEILSPSNTRQEMSEKLEFYDNNGVEEYYFYDPYKNALQGWSRSNKSLIEIENINSWVSPRLGITFRLTASTLEIYRPNGRKFLTSVELEELAEQERQRAETAQQQAEAERQRAETAQQQAEAERQRAETAQQQAEAERQRAEVERQRTQAAQQKAEAERQIRLNAATSFLSMGLSVEIVAQTLKLTVEEVEEIRRN
jgi:Uma2 family endonuclease